MSTGLKVSVALIIESTSKAWTETCLLHWHWHRHRFLMNFSIYLTRVLVNQGSSPTEGTAVSMRGWDLMNCRVSSGNSMELLKDAAGP